MCKISGQYLGLQILSKYEGVFLFTFTMSYQPWGIRHRLKMLALEEMSAMVWMNPCRG